MCVSVRLFACLVVLLFVCAFGVCVFVGGFESVCVCLFVCMLTSFFVCVFVSV